MRRPDPLIHTLDPVPPSRTIAPDVAQDLVRRIDESRALARHVASPELALVRQLLHTPLPPRTRDPGVLVRDLDVLVHVAVRAGYAAGIVPRYEHDLRAAERFAHRLAFERARLGR